MPLKKKIDLRYVLMPLIFFVAFALCFFPMREKDNEEKSVVNSSPIYYAGAADTGAASASKAYKGGAIFLEPNTSYTMTGGTISNHSNTYGGAIFISEGATFTMTGGTIKNCSASYGGGIYVRAGATCNITAGTITGCSASVAGPAIYVEEGGTLNLGEGAEVKESDIQDDNGGGFKFEINEGTYQLGKTPSSVSLQTVFFGSYPQTKVTSSLKSSLDSWYSGKASVGTYDLGGNVWTAYEYTDGEIYVRGQEKKADNDSKYKDGTSPTTGNYQWFKVEPIRWYILSNSGDDYFLYSELVLTGNVPFNTSTSDGNSWSTSNIRKFCNGEFLTKAFNEAEQKHIKDTTIGNNTTGDYSSSTSDSMSRSTTDKIYLLSYYEVSSTPFTSDNLRIAAPSDFAVGNNGYCSSGSYPTAYRSDKSGYYWLRSAGSSASYACLVNYSGNRGVYGNVNFEGRGVRPALHLNL